MKELDNISPGDIVTIDDTDESVPFVVLKTGKAEDFDESIQQQSGLKTIAGCPSDQAQVTFSGQVTAVAADDILVRLVAVPEISKHVPVWWQLDPRFYRPLVRQLKIPYRFEPRLEVQLVGRDGEICYNCGNSDFERRTVARLSIIQKSHCSRCLALQTESLLAEELLPLCDGDVGQTLRDINNGDSNV